MSRPYNEPLAQDMDNNPMQRKTWKRIKALGPSLRMVWRSTGDMFNRKPQGIYNVGRNAAKREKRADRALWRAIKVQGEAR